MTYSEREREFTFAKNGCEVCTNLHWSSLLGSGRYTLSATVDYNDHDNRKDKQTDRDNQRPQPPQFTYKTDAFVAFNIHTSSSVHAMAVIGLIIPMVDTTGDPLCNLRQSKSVRVFHVWALQFVAMTSDL